MSASRETTIWCDIQGCLNWFRGYGNAKAAREQAKQEHWRILKGQDICPQCRYNKKKQDDPIVGSS